MSQIPTIGRIVHYKLAEHDCQMIRDKRNKLNHDVPGYPHLAQGNAVEAGHVYPAIVVRTWGEQEGASVQLQVFLDGTDTFWATSVVQGDGERQWSWPPRV